MTEFTNGMAEVSRKLMTGGSLKLAVIVFIGHVLIAMAVVSIITGASIGEAGIVAVVEPAINSVWFYVLHKVYKMYNS